MTTNPNARTTRDDRAAFLLDLQQEEVSPLTLRSYQSDLASFARWFEGTIGKPFAAAMFEPVAVADCQDRHHWYGKKNSSHTSEFRS